MVKHTKQKTKEQNPQNKRQKTKEQNPQKQKQNTFIFVVKN